MVKLLYQTDSYLIEFSATVVAVDPVQNAVSFDCSAFYPGGGGQPNDTGVLMVDREGLAVTKVRRDGEICGTSWIPAQRCRRTASR